MAKLIIDTDIGIDDAFCLRWASLGHEILGFTTVRGNVSVDQATKNAKFFCRHYGLKIPVYKGASRGLVLELPTIPQIHGNDGLGNVYDNPCDADALNAVDFIMQQVAEHPHEVTIVAIGPLTNIAMALNLMPNLPYLVKELIVMGGAFGTFGHTGNVTCFSEFNVSCDPHAARQVFASPFNLTIVPLDVTHEVLLCKEEILQTQDKFLIDITKNYLKLSFVDNRTCGMSLHDALTIAYLNYPECFEVITSPVEVSTQGITIGQTLIPQSAALVPDDCFKGLPSHKICMKVNAATVKIHLICDLKTAV